MKSIALRVVVAIVLLIALAGIGRYFWDLTWPSSVPPAGARASRGAMTPASRRADVLVSDLPTTMPDSKAIDTLAKAALLDKENDGDEFRSLIQSIAGQLPEIKPETTVGRARWHRVALNRAGKKLDALRFTTPADAPRDLCWAFIFPKGTLGSWYILPAQGTMKGFTHFQPSEMAGLRNLPKSPEGARLILQDLPAANLKSGEQYVIWFQFKNTQPVEMWIALNLVRPKENTSIAVALGLKK